MPNKYNLPKLPDYEKEYKLAMERNIAEVASLVENNDKGMIFKIKSFCKRYSQEYDDIKEKILDDPIFALCFTKDPKTQNIHEKLAGEYIKKLPFVEDFKDSHEEKLCVSNGGVFAKKDLKESGGVSSAKTIDFIWKYKDLKFYAYHKYTKQSGGMQSNQYQDLHNFLNEVNKSDDDKTYFLAIADGAFYSTIPSGTNKTRLQILKKTAHKESLVFAMSIDELAEFLIDICENYTG